MFAFKYLTLALSASGFHSSRQLNLQLTGPAFLKDTRTAVITATLTNAGTEQLTLFNHPDSILSDLPTDVFAIANEAGDAPTFTGAVAKYVPERATSFTVLAPGESITVEHWLPTAYDFSFSGDGVYRIEPASSVFLIQTPTGIEHVSANTIPHIAQVAPEYIVSSRNSDQTVFFDHSIQLADQFPSCQVGQELAIILAASAANNYGENANNYLKNTAGNTVRYTTWFGAQNAARFAVAKSHFAKIAAQNFSSGTYSCDCTRDVFAYTYKTTPGKMWLCKAFWDAPLTGTDSKGGTLVHESTHWSVVAGTDDIAYGQPRCKALALNEPDRTLSNADSHEYFAENNPALA